MSIAIYIAHFESQMGWSTVAIGGIPGFLGLDYESKRMILRVPIFQRCTMLSVQENTRQWNAHGKFRSVTWDPRHMILSTCFILDLPGWSKWLPLLFRAVSVTQILDRLATIDWCAAPSLSRAEVGSRCSSGLKSCESEFPVRWCILPIEIPSF